MRNKLIYLIVLFCCIGNTTIIYAQNVGINSNGASPDNSAMLDITSTDKGLLIPRMDSTSRKNIVTPAKGLMVFDSTFNSFYYHDGTNWTSIGGGSDNLGNHTANQNIQLNNNWLNNDGGADEGIYIDSSGQVGIGTTPSANFHVSMGAYSEVNINGTYANATRTTDVCQSFTPSKTGELVSVNLLTSGSTAVTYNLYEGHGTGGTLIAGPLNQANPQAPYLFSGVTLTGGQQYTIEILNPTNMPFSYHQFGNNHGGGGICDESYSDYWFIVTLSIERPGFRIDDTKIQLNDYSLPTSDGISGQVLQTDGSGSVSWTSPAPNTDNQDLYISGNLLGLTNDPTAVNLSGYLDNTDAQDLSLSGNTLSLTNDASSVDLSSFANTDAQDLSLSGNILSLTNDVSSVDLSGFLNTDAQDLSLSGNDLSLTNDGTTVDLSGYLDNTDAQDLSLSGNTLSLTNDGTTVDLSTFAGGPDNMGNHTATQNLQLNGNWLNNDGGADKGINVDNTGQVGINTTPAATFHVDMGAAQVVNPASITHNSTTNAVTYDWQSFTPTINGTLDSVSIYVETGTDPVIYRLFEGEGSFGTFLYANTATPNNGENTFTFSGISLQKNQVYTVSLAFFNTSSTTFYYNSTNPYSEGRTESNAGWDMDFTAYMTQGNSGFRINNSGVTINEYSLPSNDGDVNQVLTTDGAGNVSWLSAGAADNLGNHTATQNIQLNNNWLSNDGDNEGINIDGSGRVGIGRQVGSIGGAKLELYGQTFSMANGPQIQVVTSEDDHPIYQQINYGHDNIGLVFDAYINSAGTAWKSSDASSFAVYKTIDHLINYHSGGNTQGGDLAWSIGTAMDSTGRFGVGRLPITNKLEVEGTASKTSPDSWLANSDARLKKNITSLSSDDILEKMLSLQGVTYEWNDTQTGTKRPEGIQFGFTAQNIQEVFPTLVTEDNNGFLQTPYGTYDAMTVEAIRALNDKIEKLENENAQLQSQLAEMDDLKSEVESIKVLLKKSTSITSPLRMETDK